MIDYIKDMATLRVKGVPILFLLLTLMGSFACSTVELDENDPAALLKEAEEDIEAKRYLLASDHLRLIKNQHPYSKEAVIASLRLADVLFLQDSFAEAAATYEAFADLHPKNESVSYARYRVGLSHYMDIPSVRARDLTSAGRAEEAFREFLERHPKDQNSADARNKLVEVRDILADKEIYVADFYFKRKHWDAARVRYQKVLTDYSDTAAAVKARKQLDQLEKKARQHPESAT